MICMLFMDLILQGKYSYYGYYMKSRRVYFPQMNDFSSFLHDLLVGLVNYCFKFAKSINV